MFRNWFRDFTIRQGGGTPPPPCAHEGGFPADPPVNVSATPVRIAARALPVSKCRQHPGDRHIRNAKTVLLLRGRFCPGVREMPVALLAVQCRAGLDRPPFEPAMRAGEGMILPIGGVICHVCPICRKK